MSRNKKQHFEDLWSENKIEEILIKPEESCSCYFPSRNWVNAVICMTTLNTVLANDFYNDSDCKHEEFDRYKTYQCRKEDCYMSPGCMEHKYNSCTACEINYQYHKETVESGNTLFKSYTFLKNRLKCNKTQQDEEKKPKQYAYGWPEKNKNEPHFCMKESSLFPKYRDLTRGYRDNRQFQLASLFKRFIFINVTPWHNMEESCFFSNCEKCITYVKGVVESHNYIKNTIKPLFPEDTQYRTHICKADSTKFNTTRLIYSLTCTQCKMELIEMLIGVFAKGFTKQSYTKIFFIANYIVQELKTRSCMCYNNTPECINYFRENRRGRNEEVSNEIPASPLLCTTCFESAVTRLTNLMPPLWLFSYKNKPQPEFYPSCPIDTNFINYTQHAQRVGWSIEREKYSDLDAKNKLKDLGLVWHKYL
jgi:hypothetical protein